MKIEDFFKIRMRNKCTVKECKTTTPWRGSIEEVCQDTIDAEWVLSEKARPTKPKLKNISYSNASGGGLTLAGGSANSKYAGITVFSDYEDEDGDASVVFDNKILSLSIGSIKTEVLGTRWYCKECAYKIMLKDILK